MRHLPEGLAHGCLWVPGCTERAWLDHVAVPENRPRFVKLAVLYGWLIANDHQVIYENASPHLVYSVDHGHFFSGGPNWTIATLAAAPPAVADVSIMNACVFDADEIGDATDDLRRLTPNAVVDAVTSSPVDWGLTEDERVALAEYLWNRRDQLIHLYPARVNHA